MDDRIYGLIADQHGW